MGDGAEREMTLDEWMDRLSVSHRAHMEYAKLNDDLDREREWREKAVDLVRQARSALTTTMVRDPWREQFDKLLAAAEELEK